MTTFDERVVLLRVDRAIPLLKSWRLDRAEDASVEWLHRNSTRRGACAHVWQAGKICERERKRERESEQIERERHKSREGEREGGSGSEGERER